MDSILNMVKAELDGTAMRHIQRQLGVEKVAVEAAVQSSVATLIPSLASNTDEPGGAEKLWAALDDHQGDLDENRGLLGNPLSSMLGGHPPSQAHGGLTGVLSSAEGSALLARIFGRRQRDAEEGIARATGLSPQQVTQLLMFLAPIVMGVLSRRKSRDRMDAVQMKRDLEASASESLQPHEGTRFGELFGLVFRKAALGS